MPRQRLSRLMVLAVLIAAVPSAAHAGLGENFEKNSLSIGGYGSLYVDFDNFMNSANDDLYFRFSVYPTFHYFLWNNTALSLSPGFYYRSDKNTDDDIDRYMAISMTAGIERFTVKNPQGKSGFVPSFGASMALNYVPPLMDLVAGAEVRNWSVFYVSAAVNLKANLFVSERTALYLDFMPRLNIDLAWWDPDLNLYKLQTEDKIRFDLGIYFGVAYHIPSSERWNVGKARER